MEQGIILTENVKKSKILFGKCEYLIKFNGTGYIFSN